MTASPSAGEPDLAASIFGLIPRLMAAEEPILAAAGISMWEYAILSALTADTAMSQVELSRRTGRDTTRLGKHLSALEERGFVVRDRAADGRQRTVGLTDEGRSVQADAKRAIRAAEDDLLAESFSAAESAEFRRLLATLGDAGAP